MLPRSSKPRSVACAQTKMTAEKNRYYELTVETVNSAATKLSAVATNRYDDKMVRYAVRLFDRRHISIEVHAAPIDPASLLNQYLFHPTERQGRGRRPHRHLHQRDAGH